VCVDCCCTAFLSQSSVLFVWLLVDKHTPCYEYFSERYNYCLLFPTWLAIQALLLFGVLSTSISCLLSYLSLVLKAPVFETDSPDSLRFAFQRADWRHDSLETIRNLLRVIHKKVCRLFWKHGQSIQSTSPWRQLTSWNWYLLDDISIGSPIVAARFCCPTV
jgi:hypothetical protein